MAGEHASAAVKVGKTSMVPVGDLAFYLGNARRGDVGAVKRSLVKFGQYKPIVVNKGSHTGRPNEVLVGNHTLKAFRELLDESDSDPLWRKIEVRWVDVDNDTGQGINVVDNRTSDLATWDESALLAQLNTMSDDDLAVLSYSPDDLRQLADLVANGAADSDPERGSGAKLALWGSTLGEPDVTPELGSVWQMGHHTVVVISVHRGWSVWAPLLVEGMVFAPYPSLMLPYSNVAREQPMLMVSPDPYIAGWLMTKWNRVYPKEAAVVVLDG